MAGLGTVATGTYSNNGTSTHSQTTTGQLTRFRVSSTGAVTVRAPQSVSSSSRCSRDYTRDCESGLAMLLNALPEQFSPFGPPPFDNNHNSNNNNNNKSKSNEREEHAHSRADAAGGGGHANNSGQLVDHNTSMNARKKSMSKVCMRVCFFVKYYI